MSDWLIILLRSVSLFFVALFLIRLLGKRNPTKTTPFNFVSYSVIAILLALMSVNIITNLAFGFISLGVWILLSVTLDYLSLKSKWFHDWINGKETILVKQGKIMEENLSQLRMTGEGLLRELRGKNAFNLSDVEFAIMEATGDINVLLKSDKKPITAHDIGQKLAPQEETQIVILDGNVHNEALANMGLNQEWLKQELDKMGLSLDNVFIGQVDSSGDLYVDLFDDSIQIPQGKVKELLYANLQKSHADLMSYALETEDSYAKLMYSKNADELKDMIGRLEPFLLK